MSANINVQYTVSERPVIGKDILELLSTAMYVDPLTIYREYVQNSADAIDAARVEGLIQEGRIEIHVDSATRSVTLRDNGLGIPSSDFRKVLTAIGASSKRGTGARGFRGVGRLSGLAYARELTFRSSALNETVISSITWDCQALRSVLRDFDDHRDLADIIGEITTAKIETGHDECSHFFEVVLTGVTRIGDDRLLSPQAVADYLSQVAPVAFSLDFELAEEIAARIDLPHSNAQLNIVVNEIGPLTRPFLNDIPIAGGRPLHLREARFVEVPSVDGGVAAIAWVAHHDYEGAISASTRVRGLRARIGNVQVGEAAIFEDIFPESRFNSWTVGEVHILDPRIVPNGRRDDFERNVHLANLKNHLAPLGRIVAAKCRTSSRERKRIRDLELTHQTALETLEILNQGTLSKKACEELSLTLDIAIVKMEGLISASDRIYEGGASEQAFVEDIRAKLAIIDNGQAVESPLDRLPPDDRAFYEKMFDLIYQCSANRNSAKGLIDRILMKLCSV